MQPLSDNNIQSELSYTYLHAVATMVGASCQPGTRHEDNNGIDAALTGWGPFPNGGSLTEIDLKVQLKSQRGHPAEMDGDLPYFLQDKGGLRYDDLRAETLSTHRILLVVFLPERKEDWLRIEEDCLVLAGRSYWVSLRGATASTNKTGQTVYLPTVQKFHPEGLISIFTRLSKKEVLKYHK
jgi:hypothetical protein